MRFTFSLVPLAVAFAFPVAAWAQQSSSPQLNLPHQSGFWGNAGLSLGRTKLHAPCPAGSDCELRDNAWRAHVGGKFNNTFGGEVGVVDLGGYARGGGETTARGVDLTLLAGFPIGENSAIFGKLGTAWLRSEVSGPGLANGTESNWNPKIGIGAQIGLTKQWSLRLDADRYRIDFVNSPQNIDVYMAGVQYHFR